MVSMLFARSQMVYRTRADKTSRRTNEYTEHQRLAIGRQVFVD